jgi:hypothetical protein
MTSSIFTCCPQHLRITSWEGCSTASGRNTQSEKDDFIEKIATTVLAFYTEAGARSFQTPPLNELVKAPR